MKFVIIAFALFFMGNAKAEDKMIESPSAFSRSQAHTDDIDLPSNQSDSQQANGDPSVTVERENSSDSLTPGKAPDATTPDSPPPLHAPPSNLHPLQSGPGTPAPMGVPHDPDASPTQR
jgi:hypothetical protein